MYSPSIILLALASSASAFNIFSRQPTVAPRQSGSCPAIWTTVATDLIADFDGCGADAHGAIRAPFHDCINNGCDGSLILADECSRTENAGLTGICTKLSNWTTTYNVSAADMIQFAAAIAISQCPLGPKVQALVGRNSSSVAAPEGEVPASRDSVDSILTAFSNKGFSSDDVVALMGTHSVALQFFDDTAEAGKSLDSTPSIYDMTFYNETKLGTAPYSLQSDKLLANNSQTEAKWASFIDDASAWNVAFTDAWKRFAVIGNDVSSMTDCSSLVPESSTTTKRQANIARFTKRMSAKFRVESK